MRQHMFEPDSFEVNWEGPSSSQSVWDESIWGIPIAMAIADGERDENRLTDQVFNMGHPELRGRRLLPSEKSLIKEWLDIRDRLVRPRLRAIPVAQAKPAPSRPFVWYSSPLPATETARFTSALENLEAMVNASNDARKWRYQCWIGKLKSTGADDRVIRWHGICPTTGVAPFYIWPCDISMGFPIEEQKIENAIRSVADLDTAGQSLGLFTYLKSDIVVSAEMTSLPLENLRMLHDDVIQAIDKLDKWANSPLGGSSSMPRAYVAMHDWIAARMSDPNSVYSCR
jgi:hypothetical protein